MAYRAPTSLLRSLWQLRYGNKGVMPAGGLDKLRGLVSRTGWKPPQIPVSGVGKLQAPADPLRLHNSFLNQGFEPKSLVDNVEAAGFLPKPIVAAKPKIAGEAMGEVAPQVGPETPPKPSYMTPDWMHQTANVLQSNPEAARKWFLGSVAGLARKKGLKYHIVAQDPSNQDLVEGGELSLDQAVELLRRRKELHASKSAGVMGLADDALLMAHKVINKIKGPNQNDPATKLREEAARNEALKHVGASMDPGEIAKTEIGKLAEWVHPEVGAQHAEKHGPELGLDEKDYQALAALLSRVRSRRPVNRRKNKAGQETQGFDIRGFRLVTTPENKIVSLYQKAAHLSAAGIVMPEYMLGGEFLRKLHPPVQDPPDAPDAPDEPDAPDAPEDFQNPEDIPAFQPLDEAQLAQIQQLLHAKKPRGKTVLASVVEKIAEEGFSTWTDPKLSENHEYTVLKDEDGKVEGYVRVQPWGNGHFLSNFWVQKAKRGKGLGKKLMNRMIETLGSEDLYLKAEPFDGGMALEKLIEYYKSFGFKLGRESLMRRPGSK